MSTSHPSKPPVRATVRHNCAQRGMLAVMVNSYLSTQQIADRLGITRDVLQHQIRAGDFIEPDVVIGDRGIQGWSPERVEEVRLDRLGNSINIESTEVFAELNRLREAAETIRAYIRHNDGSSPISNLPHGLHMLCTATESAIRNLMIVHEQFLTKVNPDSATGQPRRVPINGTSPDLIIADPATDDRVRIAELRAAAQILESVLKRLPTIYTSRAGRATIRKLESHCATLTSYIASLDAQPGELDVVRLLRPLPEHNLAIGAEGTVVEIYPRQGELSAYEVEFSDTDGVTLAMVTLQPEDIEVTWRYAST